MLARPTTTGARTSVRRNVHRRRRRREFRTRYAVIDVHSHDYAPTDADVDRVYEPMFRKYHWPLHAWALPDKVLKKVYRGNALKLLRKQQ